MKGELKLLYKVLTKAYSLSTAGYIKTSDLTKWLEERIKEWQ